MSTDRRMDKENLKYICVCDRRMDNENLKYKENGILLSHKKSETLSFVTWIPWGHYAKWNQSDRQRQILNDLLYMWNREKKGQKTEKQASRYRS